MVATSATMVSADKAKDAFDRIGFMQLKGEVDKAKATPRLAIDGSDTAANQLIPSISTSLRSIATSVCLTM